LVKRKPSHDLEAFKAAFARFEAPMTAAAALGAHDLGYAEADVIELVGRMTRSDFVKSMTSYSNHRQWQDVYNVDDGKQIIYLKFTDHMVT
jgi:motility quorum-sensing regulator / GCU-specific mRNA interferase toxin